MALSEATENLRRSFTSLLSLRSRIASSKVLPNSRTICSSTLGSAPYSVSAATCTDRGNSFSRDGRVQNVGLPLTVSFLLHQPRTGLLMSTPSASGIGCRGMASKAHMKYAKRKKAPVNRFGDLDPSQPRLGFEKVDALESADDNVKKLFSLEFGSGTDLHKLRRKMSEDLVWDTPDDKKDLAVKIATITEHIKAVAAHVETNKKDSENKVRLLNAIDRRRKMLKYLRRRDYGRFKRLLAELDLIWTPPPEYYRRQTRRAAEKQAFVDNAHAQRRQALLDFEAAWRAEQILEIAKLKEELGKELEEEERLALKKSREES